MMPEAQRFIEITGFHAHLLDGRRGELTQLVVRGSRFSESARPAAAKLQYTVDLRLPGICLIPGLSDSHIHQIEAERDLDTVDLSGAGSLEDVLDLLRARAETAVRGEWVVARRGWHEFRLKEGRLPTQPELDGVSRSHPIAVRRGSHVAVLNTEALGRARGLQLERDERGDPTGLVRGSAAIDELVRGGAVATVERRAAALARTTALHASRGLVGVRDAGISRDDLEVYKWSAARGGIGIRTDALIAVPTELTHPEKLRFVRELGPPPGQLHHELRVDTLKLFIDGRIDDAALREPYANRHASGRLFMNERELEQIVETAVTLGWRVGAHVVGDYALDVALEGYGRVLGRHQELAPGWLMIEHALLADENQRLRATALGIGVTLQHALLYEYADLMLDAWGEDRVHRASPTRGWLDAGALVAAGSDGHVVPFDPMLSLWGMTTRGTATAGRLDLAEAVDLTTALRLHSVDGHWSASWRIPAEAFEAESYADFVGFETCVFDTPPDRLRDVSPVLTVLGGRAVHDVADLWPTE